MNRKIGVTIFILAIFLSSFVGNFEIRLVSARVNR